MQNCIIGRNNSPYPDTFDVVAAQATKQFTPPTKPFFFPDVTSKQQVFVSQYP